ncbi:hypothetical protein [Streptomyces sp.]|uniref:hypothetical protein n=1 Tax=Streptomyces sp. TaxID=1931 RepID=UPI00281275C9|nr:hypothetical protein [Streptomyces sp.]
MKRTSPGKPKTRAHVVDARWSHPVEESDHTWSAPEGYVIVGREHQGGPGGNTRYRYARLVLAGRELTVRDVRWSRPWTEADGVAHAAPDDHVLVGREHIGEGSGTTRHQYARLMAGTVACSVTPGEWSAELTEEWSVYRAPADAVLLGRRCVEGEKIRSRYLPGTVEA